ncbi:hypothetical protein [Trichothermofontia sp.]
MGKHGLCVPPSRFAFRIPVALTIAQRRIRRLGEQGGCDRERGVMPVAYRWAHTLMAPQSKSRPKQLYISSPSTPFIDTGV